MVLRHPGHRIVLEWISSIPTRWIWAVGVVILVAVAYRMAVRALRRLSSEDRLSTPYVLIRRVVRWVAILLGGLLFLEALDVLRAAWTTVTAGLTLVAVGFVAMWSVLSHATCAVILMIAGPFSIGDTIEFTDAPNLRGEVVDCTLLYTFLRSDNGDLLQIPNNMFFQRAIRREEGSTEISLEQQLGRDAPAETTD